MTRTLILASASAIRLALLQRAGLVVQAMAARIDEEALRRGLEAETAAPRDIADTLAEMKARKIASRHGDAVVIGCDQVLTFNGRIWGKPDSIDAARAQLHSLRGASHQLLSAVVLYDAGRPVWRHMGEVTLTMRQMSDDWIDDYLTRNWPGIADSVGAYKLEEEGVRLFTAVEGDYFTVLGLPLLPLLSYLGQRGFITT